MDKEIGGYIELELPKVDKGFNQIIDSKILLNSGRNAIKYIVLAYNIKELWVPYYTCPVVWQALKEENVILKFYKINDNFLPDLKFDRNDYILYTNYFGICSENIKTLIKDYPNIIIDNAQAFYMPPMGLGSAYSPRKFFGVSDGGIVWCNKKLDKNFKKDMSFNRFSHLLKRIDCGSNFGYKDFWDNDNSLNGAEILTMSNLTQRILKSIDYDDVKKKRIENYKYLHEQLKELNMFSMRIQNDDVPMYYPFIFKDSSLRERMLENKIYIPFCWRDMEQYYSNNSYELFLNKYMFPLIIDQRYYLNDMQKIVNVILNK